MNKVKFVLLSAGISLALGFVFSCSSDSDSDNSGGNGSLSSSSKGVNNPSSSSSTGISSSSRNNSSSSVVNSSSSSIVQSSSSSVVLKECDAIFNPDNKFCYDGTVYDKCGAPPYIPLTTYNPTTQGCLEGKVEEKCGSEPYSQAKQFCYEGSIYNKCSGNIYNPTTQGCLEGKVEEKCGSEPYSQAKQFCYDDIIYDKCDGMVYSPTSYICQNGVATLAKCGNEGYNPLTQYCGNGTVKNYDSVTDARDGKKYKTVEIGNQTWMAENLNYVAESSKCYNDNTAYCDKYGRLYNFGTAMVVCPSGWHLPSNTEWDALITAAGGNSTAGTKLKAISGWIVENSSSNGTNDYGFSALPGGGFLFFYGGSYESVGSHGYWWGTAGGNFVRLLIYNFLEVVQKNEYTDPILDYFSVRCLQGTSSSSSNDFCNYGVCQGGNGSSCKSGGCFRMPTNDNCKSGTLVSVCPSGTKPPGADW